MPKKAIPDKNKIILVVHRQNVMFFLMEKIHKDQFFRRQWELQRMKQTQKASIINSTDCLLQLESVVSRKLHRLNFDDKAIKNMLTPAVLAMTFKVILLFRKSIQEAQLSLWILFLEHGFPEQGR